MVLVKSDTTYREEPSETLGVLEGVHTIQKVYGM